MRYIVTYSYIPNCPACDGPIRDAEFCGAESYYSLEELLEGIKKQVNSTWYFRLYRIEDDGVLVEEDSFSYLTGGHNTISVTFNAEGKRHKIFRDPVSKTYMIATEAYKVLYEDNKK